MAAIRTDPQVTPWLGPLDQSEMRGRMEGWLEHWRRHGFGQWTVEVRASGRMIGRVGLVFHDDWNASAHDAEIGWMLDPAEWRRGYATEAARAVLDWARARGAPRQIVSIARADNLRSRRVMERLGLVLVGQTRWHELDHVWYALDLGRAQASLWPPRRLGGGSRRPGSC